MTLERLGQIDLALVGPHFFQQDLAKRVSEAPSFSQGFGRSAAVILIQGSVTGPEKSLARDVTIIGTTPEFWEFFPDAGEPQKLAGQTIVNAELATELGLQPGERIVASVEKASAIPREGLLGERDEVLWRLPVNVDAMIPTSGVGRFGLYATQRLPKNLFVPIERLARIIDQPGRANALFFEAKSTAAMQSPDLAQRCLDEAVTLADYGLEVPISSKFGYVALQSRRLILEPVVAGAAKRIAGELQIPSEPILTYLANRIAVGKQEIPYSVVTALPPSSPPPLGPLPTEPPDVSLGSGEILLNQWSIDQLQAKLGDTVTLDYYEVADDGSLVTTSHNFRLTGAVAMEGIAIDRDYAPTYPGISDADNFADWDPPFPVDLRKVKKVDEDYWDDYRTAPKGFVSLAQGQELWHSRFGNLTSLRFAPKAGETPSELQASIAKALREALQPADLGLSVEAVKFKDLAASSGSTDFGGLFIAFSFFLIVSAAFLVGLLFRLSVEQRASQIGLLLAVGVPLRRTRWIWLAEGLMLSLLGGVLGLGGAILYAKSMLWALTNWWREAVGTPFVSFHWSRNSLAIGLLASILLAMVAITWGVGRLRRARVPQLLLPGFSFAITSGPKRAWLSIPLAGICLVAGLGLTLLPRLAGADPVVSFFSAAALLLIGALAALSAYLRQETGRILRGQGALGLARLGMRNATRYPTRGVLSAGLIASATFVVVAVGMMRHGHSDGLPKFESGNGGFALIAESDVPIYRSLSNSEARYDLNLSEKADELLADSVVYNFRRRPGEDASCLNIYQPTNPTILGAPEPFLKRGGFLFANSMATDDEQRANPWLLLSQAQEDDAIPAIGDANTLQWILKVGVGNVLEVPGPDGKPVKLRMVAALSGSIFQSELVISEKNFQRLFPANSGSSLFLIGCQAAKARELGLLLEKDLSGYGLDATLTSERLATFRAVENTYMATFQTLGGLGVLLGTVGLGAVVARNVLERRGELGLLRALGLRKVAVGWLVLAETAWLLVAGLGIGTFTALVAVFPQLFQMSSFESTLPLALLLLGILVTGLLSGVLGVVLAMRLPIIPSLRAE